MEILNSVLEIIGVVALILFIVVIGVVWRFWRKIKKSLREIGDSIQNDSGTPQTIHLNESIDSDWMQNAIVLENASLLEAKGFLFQKSYDVAEIPDVQLAVYMNSQGIQATVNFHEKIGCWLELLAKLPADKYLSVNNSLMTAFLEHPDWLEMHILEAKPGEEVVERFFACLGNRTVLQSTIEEFREEYEGNYRRLMQWKNQQGGMSYAEVEFQNSRLPKPLTNEKLKEAYRTVKRNEFSAWHIAMYDEIKNHPKIDTEQDVFIVPNNSDCVAFFEYIESFFQWNDRQREGLLKLAQNRTDSGKLFDAMNSRLSPELRAEEKCVIEFPLDARVFSSSDIDVHQLDD